MSHHDVQISIRISQSLLERLKRVSAAEDRPTSYVMRRAVAAEVERLEEQVT